MLDAARALAAGGSPLGLDAAIRHPELHSEEQMIPLDWPWQAALDRPLEPASTA
jgi:hypothetical protein